ncbi:GL16266 [Drosophila persimilis]|uniref:GL16266 n=1 Tax=Drosophila persimilis TaxID=7234 RepID=B4GQL8_DROPE|nr:tax1-binding protein 1 homolog B [Drosophila persimilis]EDW39890.1 GL16266 [Drosophila persimilis]
MAKNPTITDEMEMVIQQGNTLLPDLHIRPSDLANPTEAFLTKVYVHYLRCFGLRVDPPFNVDNESTDTSREKRVFLIKLCRQVERIVQVTFPNKTYTYLDIIRPAPKKTIKTLDPLFNYLAYYKMFKRSVLMPVEESIKTREALIAEITSKRCQLENRKEKAATVKTDIENCQASINELHEELPRAQAEVAKDNKTCAEQRLEMDSLENQHTELTNQIRHWEQLVVEDDEVLTLKKQIEDISQDIENCKDELAGQEKVFNDQRHQIETNLNMVNEIEKALEVLPSNCLDEYKENLKQQELVEKQLSALEAQNQKILNEIETNNVELQQSAEQFQICKHKYDEECQKLQQQIDARKTAFEEQKKTEEERTKNMEALQRQLQEQELMGKMIEEMFLELGKNGKST